MELEQLLIEELEEIYAISSVKKEFRKKGIGRALIDHVARRYHPVELEVYEKNKTALKFYLDLSFSEVERSIGESTKEVQLRLRLEKCL